MKLSRFGLLALLSVLSLVATSTIAVAADGPAHLSGNVEVGVTGMDTDDNPARVNEYAKYRSDKGINFAPSLDLEYLSKEFSLGIEGAVRGPHDQDYALEADVNRILQLDLDYQVFQHWKDHDTLEALGATMFGDVAGQQPRVTTDLTAGQIGVPGDTLTVANERYYQELDNNYIIDYKEFTGETDLTIPSLPNVTFHAGYRIETRKGLEQATTMSKCNQCHVQANGKDIDEKTKDYTLGATGKFGLLTVDYEYLNRTFDADGSLPDYNYLSSGMIRDGVADVDTMLYTGMQEYSDTPDSDKDSHSVEARLDLARDTMLSASYVHADIDSDKNGETGVYTLNKDTLSSKFESFFLKGATRIGNLRLSVTGGTYEIDGPDYRVNFPDRDDMLIADGGNSIYENQDFPNPEHYESAESRDVTRLGIDGVYRLSQGTTLRLGYEYEDVDRDLEELGETKTNTFKVALKSRLSSKLSGRISYQYQDIDDPFHGEDATGIAQGIGSTDPAYPGLEWLNTADYVGVYPNPDNSTVYYWNSVYPNRTLDATNQPDSVHEGKFSSTWAPASNVAMTVFARVRIEENDDVDYKQHSYVPGASIYYAPSNNLILTLAYTFNKMKTENQMCVGWYHG
jgi:hypothetical protein